MLNILIYVLVIAVIFIVLSDRADNINKKLKRAVSNNKLGIYNTYYHKLQLRLKNTIVQCISLSESKKEKTELMLRLVNKKNLTAEKFYAENISSALVYFVILFCMYLLCKLPMFETLGIVAIIFLIMAFFIPFYYIYKENIKLTAKYKRHIRDVENELPKLCTVVHSRLTSTKNVQEILKGYMPIANKAMQYEIGIALEDMRTGNTIVALQRLEQRVKSGNLSDVVRGLIAVANGDEQSIYFATKHQQFNNEYMNQKKKEISMRPMGLSTPMFIAILFFMIIILYPILLSAGDIFGEII